MTPTIRTTQAAKDEANFLAALVALRNQLLESGEDAALLQKTQANLNYFLNK